MDKKVKNWLEKGIIDEQTANRINEDIKAEKERNRAIRINITLYSIAAILIGTGIISFIAANDWILKLFKDIRLLKIFLMILLSAGSLYGGYKLSEEGRTYKKLGLFLITLSAFLIGGTYAIIGQTYNFNSGNYGLYLIWLISILPLAYIFKNIVINSMAIILFITFFTLKYVDLNIDGGMVWTVFMPVLLGLIMYSCGNLPLILKNYPEFSLQYKIVGLGAIYVTLLILTISVETSYQLTSPYYLIPVCCLIVLGLLNYFFSERKNDSLIMAETIFTVFLSVSLLILLILSEINTKFVMFIVHWTLIAMIVFCFHYGYKEEKEKVVSLANHFLTIYLAVIYCRWGWSFMNKTAFFLIGGLLILTLGIFLERKRQLLKKSMQQEGAENE